MPSTIVRPQCEKDCMPKGSIRYLQEERRCQIRKFIPVCLCLLQVTSGKNIVQNEFVMSNYKSSLITFIDSEHRLNVSST
jgi:hypothetical protein